MRGFYVSKVQLVLAVGRQGEGAQLQRPLVWNREHSGSLFALPLRTNTTPLEACLAPTLPEERADYSRRSEMTKHGLTPLLWRLAPTLTAAPTLTNIIRGGKCRNYVRHKRDIAIGPVVSLHASTMSRCPTVWRVPSHLKLYGLPCKQWCIYQNMADNLRSLWVVLLLHSSLHVL